jgi:hemoglobin/transferrin/lactoferrin receptor protein
MVSAAPDVPPTSGAPNTTTATSANPATASAATSTTTLREVTVSATRTENAVEDVPATVSVTTRKQLDDRVVKDIRTLTRYEPNVSVGNSSTRFGLTGFNIRGIEGNRILMQIDGVRLPDQFSIGSFSFATRDSVDLDLLKQVEILRGPGSSLYGSDALGGVVSFLTKDPSDLLRETTSEHYLSAKTTLASADRSVRVAGTLATGRNTPWQLLISVNRAEGNETRNRGDIDVRGALRTLPNPVTNSSTNGLAKWVWAVSPSGPTIKLTLEAREARSNVDVATLNSLSPRTTDLRAEDSAKRNRLGAELLWPRVAFMDEARAVISRQESSTAQTTRERRDLTSAGCSGTTVGTNTCAREVTFTFDQDIDALTLQAVTKINHANLAQRLSYGVDVSRTDFSQLRDGRQTVTSATGISTSTSQVGADLFPVRDFPLSKQTQTGVYIQDEIYLLDGALTVTPSLRYDRYKLTPQLDDIYAADNPGVQVKGLTQSATSPRLGVLWKLLPELALYAQYAQGFRAPPYNDVNFGFTNFAFGYTAIPNAALKPEKSRGAEFGVRGSGERFSYAVTGFQNRYRDFIASLQALPCPGDPRCSTVVPITFQSVNIGRVRINGWEARGDYKFDGALKGVTAIASVGQTRGDNLITGQPLDSIDPRKTVAGIKYDAPSRLFGTEFVLTHWARQSRPATATQFIPDAVTTADLYGYWQPLKSLRITAAWQNMTNEKYWLWADVRGVASSNVARDRFTQPGRHLSLAAQVTF